MTEENQTPEVETPVVETAVETTAVVETPVEEAKPSLSDAITAGIESAPARGPKKPADEATGEVEGEEGSGAGEKDEKDGAEDATDAGDEGAGKKDDKEDPDHVNDPVPKEWSERARERITSLVGSVKEKDQQLEVQGNLINAVISTGASAEQFGGVIAFLRDLNNTTEPAAMDRCLTALDGMRRAVAMRIGKPVDGIDFLEDEPDLKQAVHYGQITKEAAQELAIARASRKAHATFQTQQHETAQAAAAAEKARNDAITDLNQLGETLAATDPDYQAKYDAIVGPLSAAFSDLPPNQWRALFEKAYKVVKVTKAAPTVPVNPTATAMARDPVTGQFAPVKKGQPIRPVSPSGTSGSKAAPKSMREAIDFSLSGDNS